MKVKLNVDVHHLTRVEGHGNIKVRVEDGEIKEARWDVVETPRYFEVMFKGKHYTSAGILAARICGICSIAHCLTSLRATEDAFEVTIPEAAAKLRVLDVGQLAGEVIGLRLRIARHENSRKLAEDAARKVCEQKTAQPKAELKEKTALIDAWTRTQPRPNGAPLSWTFPRAIVRLITGQPKVKVKSRVRIADVVARLRESGWGGKCLRLSPTWGALRARRTLERYSSAVLYSENQYTGGYLSQGRGFHHAFGNPLARPHPRSC